MRRLLAVILLLSLVGYCAGTLTKPYYTMQWAGDIAVTAQYGYIAINSVSANDTAPTTTTKSWATIESVYIPIDPKWSIVELGIYGYGDGSGAGSPNNGTCTILVYACREYGNAKQVYEGAVTIGAQQMSNNPVTGAVLNSGTVSTDYCWADTVDANGVGAVWVSSIVLSGDNGADNVASISFDMNGYWGLYVYVKDISSITTVTVVASGY